MLEEPARLGELFGWLGVDDDVRPGTDEAVNASSATHDRLDEELLVRLRDYFAESDAALAVMLGRDLPWTHRLAP